MGHQENIKKKTREQRDLEAGRYDLSFSSYANAVEMPTTIRRLGLSDRDITLDVGAGTGRFTLELAQRCRRVVAVDFSFNSLKVCREKCRQSVPAKVHFVVADISMLPFRDEIFDKAGSSQVLQDLPTSEQRVATLSEVGRVVKRGGEVVITTFNYPLAERMGIVKYAGKKEGYHHTGESIYYYRFTYFEFKRFLSCVPGFSVEEACGIRNIPAKPIGEWLCKAGLLNFSLWLDYLIEKNIVSALTGRFLLAKLIKK